MASLNTFAKVTIEISGQITFLKILINNERYVTVSIFYHSGKKHHSMSLPKKVGIDDINHKDEGDRQKVPKRLSERFSTTRQLK